MLALKITDQDTKFNKISFRKKTSYFEMLYIAEKPATIIKNVIRRICPHERFRKAN